MHSIAAGSERQRCKWPGRIAWAAVALPVVWLSAAGIPFRYTQLLEQNQWFQNEMGLHSSPEFAALVVLLLELFAGLVFLLSSAFFAWYKSDERIGLLVAFGFLAQAATFPGMTDALIDATMTTRWLSWSWFIFSLRALASALSIVLFYLLPDGRFVPSWTKILAPIWIAVCAIQLLFPEAPFSVVYGESFRATETASILFVSAWWLSGIVALLSRYRSATGIARQQIKWIMFGMILAGLGSISYLFIRPLHTALGFSSDAYVIGRTLVSSLLFACLPVCITIAIFRYHLWRLDTIINRTLVYGVLTFLTMSLYVLIVGGLGSLLQPQSIGVLAFLAAGLVAVFFQPLRLRLQSAVDHVMYGRRDDPVRLLTDLAHRLESVDRPDQILPTLVETVASALKLPYVAVSLSGEGDGQRTAAAYGTLFGDVLALPLLHQNEEIGRLLVAPRGPGEGLNREEERLLATIAQLSATTLLAVRLSSEIQRSRRQIVTSREEERRRLRRDLHDGIGPLLAGISLQADTGRELVNSDPAETEAILNSIMEQAQSAVSDVRRLVYNLRPPALDELGLVGALEQSVQAYQQKLRVKIVRENELPPLPAAVEVAAYRIVQEAINNVVKHAGAKNCTVTLSANDELHLLIEDDGGGLAPLTVPGVGLISMRERASELGGSCMVETLPEGGARVTACLPLHLEGS
ncbi:MAG: histidine kinase [Candidatus Promineifilaceae bacterium]